MAHQGLPSTGSVLLEVLRHWPRPTLFTNALPHKVIFWESESELVQPAKKLVIRKISFLCKTLIPFRVVQCQQCCRPWSLLTGVVGRRGGIFQMYHDLIKEKLACQHGHACLLTNIACFFLILESVAMKQNWNCWEKLPLNQRMLTPFQTNTAFPFFYFHLARAVCESLLFSGFLLQCSIIAYYQYSHTFPLLLDWRNHFPYPLWSLRGNAQGWVGGSFGQRRLLGGVLLGDNWICKVPSNPNCAMNLCSHLCLQLACSSFHEW